MVWTQYEVKCYVVDGSVSVVHPFSHHVRGRSHLLHRTSRFNTPDHQEHHHHVSSASGDHRDFIREDKRDELHDEDDRHRDVDDRWMPPRRARRTLSIRYIHCIGDNNKRDPPCYLPKKHLTNSLILMVSFRSGPPNKTNTPRSVNMAALPAQLRKWRRFPFFQLCEIHGVCHRRVQFQNRATGTVFLNFAFDKVWHRRLLYNKLYNLRRCREDSPYIRQRSSTPTWRTATSESG